MTETEILYFISNFEEKYDVQKWVVEDRHIWPLIRIKMSFFLRHKYTKKRCVSRKIGGRFSRYFSVVRGICSSLLVPLYPIWSKKKNYDVLVFHDNFDRNIKLLDECVYDHVLDPIVDIFHEHKCKCLELEQNCGDDRINIRNKSYSVELYLMIINLLSKIKRKNTTLLLEEYNSFLSELPSDLAYELTEMNLVREVKCINEMAKFFKVILKRHNIRIVILSCWYSTYNFALSIACSDMNIRSVDVQHGIAGASNHSSYANWRKFPDTANYEMMPSLFWSWTKDDADAINSWNTDHVKAFFYGKPILYNVDNIVMQANIDVLERIKLNLPMILVTLQWGHTMPDWLVTYIKKNAKCFIWLIRFHPVKDKSQVEFVNKIKDIENVYIDGVDKIILEILLCKMTMHITYSSSVIVDAYMYGKKSIMLNIGAYDRYANLINNNNVFLVNDMLEMANRVDTILEEKTKPIKFTCIASKKKEIIEMLLG